MVQGIPIFKVVLSEGLFNRDVESDKLFGYCIEANKGPVAEPTYVASKEEALATFGVNFAPHFYQKGSGLALYRVEFDGSAAPFIIYKAYTEDYTIYQLERTEGHENEFVPENERKTVEVLKVTATKPGTPKHKVNLSKSLTSAKAYNLTVTIDGVGSKKYQNISSLANVVKKINNKFADYLKAELLIDEDIMLGTKDINGGDNDTLKLTETKSLIYDPNATENQYSLKNTSDVVAADNVISKGKYNPSRLFYNKDANGKIMDTLSGGSNGKLRKTDGTISDVEIPDTGLQIGMAGTGTGDHDANVNTTLLYAYRQAFKALEDVDLLGVATLSNSDVVQNELIAHIEELIDPEVAKYRFGVTGFLNYPGKDMNGRENPQITIDVDSLAESTAHIDNPFIVYVGQGVVFEEEGVRYNLLPHEAVQLYTGIRSKLDYDQSIFGGANSKVLNGVVDVLPLTNDGADIYKEDRITLNQAGVLTFLKRKENVTFLQGVTTAQEDVVLSHENIMSIVVYVLRQLVEAAWPFMGEILTEDLKVGFANTLSDVLKNIQDTDNSLMALEDYNIPPYDVEIRATTVNGFDESGKLIRQTKLLAIVKIVPRGAVDAIELSVIVI